MKNKELPYIKLNGADTVGEGVPFRSRKHNRSCFIKKQASISCEVLNRVGGDNAMNANSETDSNGTNQNNYLQTQEFNGDKPGARSTRNSFSCGATREEGSSSSASDLCAKFYDLKQKCEEAKLYEVVYPYEKGRDDEFDLAVGDTIRLLTEETSEKNWWCGLNDKDEIGLFPSQYVKFIAKEPKIIPPGTIVPTEELLGRGNFGNVIKVLYESKAAALKKPSKSQYFSILEKEALMIYRFKHPHIVELYGISLSDPRGLLLELCEGGSLKAVLNNLRSRFVSIRVLVEWALQVSDAMKFVIQAQCIHRDLKTDNILIKESICLCNLPPASRTETPTDEFYSFSQELDRPACSCGRTLLSKVTLKLTDFGLTKAFKKEDELKRQSQTVGTLAYLAPEAFSKTQYSEASDVWSFGVVLWSILTKEEPYKDSQVCCAFAVATNHQSSLEITRECPEQWKDIMLKCWQPLPSGRPSFAELHSDFLEYKKNLQADEITNAQEATVQMAQQAVANFVRSRSISGRMKKTIQDTMESKLREISEMIDEATQVLDNEKKNSNTTVVPRYSPRRKKIGKNQIGNPVELRHLCSVVNTDNKTQSPGKAERTIIIPTGAGRWNPNPLFSSSSPQLNLLGTEPHGLKRCDAIKRRDGGRSAVETESLSQQLATVEIANIDDVASASDPGKHPSHISPPPRLSSLGSNSSSNKTLTKKSCIPLQRTHGVPIRPAPRLIKRQQELSLSDDIPSPSGFQTNPSEHYIPLSNNQYTLNTVIPNRNNYDNGFSMSPPTQNAPSFQSGITLPSTRPAGQDENPYVLCGQVPPGVHHHQIVNNTYLNVNPSTTSHAPKVNPHYISYQQNNINRSRQNAAEKKRATPISNSAYVSLADHAPTTIAPPPPTPTISPPVIPPREGTVGLPPVRQVAS